MNDVTVADWSSLVAARLELDRAALLLDDAMQRLKAGVCTEKTMATGALEAAFDRMRAAKLALTVAELAISEPHPVE
jgi:hypothetical protein